jgi:hypothetical protein
MCMYIHLERGTSASQDKRTYSTILSLERLLADFIVVLSRLTLSASNACLFSLISLQSKQLLSY